VVRSPTFSSSQAFTVKEAWGDSLSRCARISLDEHDADFSLLAVAGFVNKTKDAYGGAQPFHPLIEIPSLVPLWQAVHEPLNERISGLAVFHQSGIGLGIESPWRQEARIGRGPWCYELPRRGAIPATVLVGVRH